MQITQFEVRKGSYEYNTLVSLLAKLYLNKPTREVPRQEIYDKIKEEFGDYNVNAIRKMMTFCQRKVSEWKQEEVRKITSVEDDKRHFHQMDTLSLAESVCQPKMVNVTPKIMYALSLIRKFQRDEEPERSGFWTTYQNWYNNVGKNLKVDQVMAEDEEYYETLVEEE
ncbi:uncharacterized protein [Ptychodera flava]|uniref:uncharacterized protein n=1 Tax=Ptychodera flava TaxID=63121 RepID=UPI00396A6F97